MNIRKFQEGGTAPVPTDQGAANDPLAQLITVAAQAVQNQDCNAAMQVCQFLLQSAQGAAQAPVEGGAPEGEPVYRKGGKLLRRRY